MGNAGEKGIEKRMRHCERAQESGREAKKEVGQRRNGREGRSKEGEK